MLKSSNEYMEQVQSVSELNLSKSHKVALVKKRLQQWQQKKVAQNNHDGVKQAPQSTSSYYSKLNQNIEDAVARATKRQDNIVNLLKKQHYAYGTSHSELPTAAQNEILNLKKSLSYKSAEVVLLREMLQGVAKLSHEIELAAPNVDLFFKVRGRDKTGAVTRASAKSFSAQESASRREALKLVSVDYSSDATALKAYNVMLRRTITDMVSSGKISVSVTEPSKLLSESASKQTQTVSFNNNNNSKTVTPNLSKDIGKIDTAEEAVQRAVKDELAQVMRLKSQLETECATLNADNQRLQQTLKDRENYISSIQSEFDAKFEQQQATWEEHFRARIAEFEKAAPYQTELETMERDTEQTIAVLQNEIKLLRQNLSSEQLRSAELERHLNSKPPLTDSSASISLVNALEEKDRLINQLQLENDRINSVELSHTNLVSERQYLTNSLEQKDAVITEMQARIIEFENEIRSVNDKLIDKQNHIQSLETLNQEKDVKLSLLLTQIESRESHRNSSEFTKRELAEQLEEPGKVKHYKNIEIELTNNTLIAVPESRSTEKLVSALSSQQLQVIESAWFEQTRHLRDHINALDSSFKKLKKILLEHADLFVQFAYIGGDSNLKPSIHWQRLEYPRGALEQSQQNATNLYSVQINECVGGYKIVHSLLDEILAAFQWLCDAYKVRSCVSKNVQTDLIPLPEAETEQTKPHHVSEGDEYYESKIRDLEKKLNAAHAANRDLQNLVISSGLATMGKKPL